MLHVVKNNEMEEARYKIDGSLPQSNGVFHLKNQVEKNSIMNYLSRNANDSNNEVLLFEEDEQLEIA